MSHITILGGEKIGQHTQSLILHRQPLLCAYLVASWSP